MTRQIVIFDDNPDDHKWATTLQVLLNAEREYEVKSATKQQFADVFDALVDRSHLPKAEAQHEEPEALCLVDEGQILVVDNDINPTGPDAPLGLKGKSGRRFAALARHFGNVSAIVVVNTRYSRPTFDLTGGAFDGSLADFHIDSQSLTQNPAFWRRNSATTASTFRPLHWPGVLDLVESLEHWIESDPGNHGAKLLTQHVAHVLGIDPTTNALTVEQFEGLWPDGLDEDPETRAPNGLTVEESLKADRATSLGPDTVDVEARRLDRSVVYSLSRLARSLVLPPQNVWVDAWHAVKMFGFEFSITTAEEATALARQWDTGAPGGSTTTLPDPIPIATILAGRHVFAPGSFPESARGLGFPLCEDISEFAENDVDATAYNPRDEGPLSRRYVSSAKVRGGRWDVVPQVRLLG